MWPGSTSSRHSGWPRDNNRVPATASPGQLRHPASTVEARGGPRRRSGQANPFGISATMSVDVPDAADVRLLPRGALREHGSTRREHSLDTSDDRSHDGGAKRRPGRQMVLTARPLRSDRPPCPARSDRAGHDVFPHASTDPSSHTPAVTGRGLTTNVATGPGWDWISGSLSRLEAPSARATASAG